MVEEDSLDAFMASLPYQDQVPGTLLENNLEDTNIEKPLDDSVEDGKGLSMEELIA